MVRFLPHMNCPGCKLHKISSSEYVYEEYITNHYKSIVKWDTSRACGARQIFMGMGKNCSAIFAHAHKNLASAAGASESISLTEEGDSEGCNRLLPHS